MSDRRTARRQLGAAALFSEAEAVALLTCRDSIAREWLRSRGLVRDHPQLGRIVIWADVLEAIRLDGTPAEPEPRPATGYPRARLGRIK